MSLWQQLFVLVGGGTVFQIVVAFLVRSLFTHWLDKDLAAHRARLDAENQVELERLKFALQKSATEHQIRFSSLHAKAAAAIGETYSLLLTFYKSVTSYASEIEAGPVPSRTDQLAAVNEANKAFGLFFFRNEIYIDPVVCEKIREFYRKLYVITNDCTRAMRSKAGPSETWERVVLSLDEEAKPLFKELRSAFRELVGTPATQG